MPADWLEALNDEADRLWRARWRAALGSDHWRSLKAQVVQHLNGKCQWPMCSRLHTPETPLHLHHKHYRTLGHETMEDVLLYCPEHHEMTHRFKRWRRR